MCVVSAQYVFNLIDMHDTNNIMKCVEYMVLTEALFTLMRTLD
jgi:hypothetical protein